jgi:hypothetical protein
MAKRIDHVEAAREECFKYGATFSFSRGKKNIVGIISLNGKTRKLFMSITPSDWRVFEKIRKNVRDYIKEMRA